jgi:O-antigen/teichoic acid export membrane protein
LRFAAEYTLRLASNLILTRLLVPEAFGLMALVSVLMTGLAMFSDVGITATAVQNRRGDDRRFLDTVWTLQVLRGLLLYLLAVALAPLMASFYDEPELRSLLWAAGLTAVLAGFNSISLVSLQRHLRIRKLVGIEVGAQAIGNGATIVWALAAPSVWALVWGGLIGSAAKLLISHLTSRDHPPRFAWERESLQAVLAFGKWIFLSTILFFLAGQADRLIFGSLLSVSMLGVFSIAATFATMPTQVVWRIGNAVLFPALSRRGEVEAGDREGVEGGAPTRLGAGMGRVYRRALMPLLVAGALPVACMWAAAPELIEILYDDRYHDAGWMLQLLAIGTWIQIPQAASGAVVLSLGTPRWLATANAVKFVAMIALLPLGYLHFDEGGAIAGLAGAELFRYLTLALAVRRARLPGFLAELGMTAGAVGLGLAGFEAASWVGSAGGGPLARMAAAVVTIGALWLPASALLLRDEIPRLREGLRNRRAAAASGSNP